MKKTLILLTALILIIPGFVFSDLVTFKVGYFLPRGASYDINNPRPDDLWWIEFDQMTFNPSTYQTTNFGFSYEYFFSNHLSLVLNIDSYSKNKLGQYMDYVGYSFDDGDFAFPVDFEGDFYPSHSFSVSITPFQLSVKIAPLGSIIMSDSITCPGLRLPTTTARPRFCREPANSSLADPLN